MKMILDTDQRKLLKLRSSVLLHSSESDSKSILKARKITDKQQMLDLYVENLRTKKLDNRDIKLLNITGLNEVIEILGAREEFNYKLRIGKEFERGQKDIEIDMVNRGVNVNDLTEIIEEQSIYKKESVTDDPKDRAKNKRKTRVEKRHLLKMTTESLDNNLINYLITP